MDERTEKLLQNLTEAFGPSGFEDDVRSLVQRQMEEIGPVQGDGLGSLWLEMVGDARGPRVMLAGHLDEIGFLITQITDDGFLRFQTLGGWWEQVMLAQRVCIKTRRGFLTGVIGSKPPHILTPEKRRKVTKKTEMFIDIGVQSADEARAAGVRPGDPAVPICPFERLANPKYMLAKAWDNRIGCALALETARRVQEGNHPGRLFAVTTVQEEVGLRGAGTSAFALEPDVAIALDVGIAGDTPGIKAHEAQARLGDGPLILIYDGSLIPNHRLRDFVFDVAESEHIPYQTDTVSGGGTDAGRIHVSRSGVPSLALGVPARYIHTHASIIHADDFENTVRLLTAVVRRLDEAALQKLRF